MLTSPLVFILFGSTGDLAQKKIMPSLLRLFQRGALPRDTMIIAFSRRSWDDNQYRAFIRPSLEKYGSTGEIDAFLGITTYVQGTFDDPASYSSLISSIEHYAQKVGKVLPLFHLAIQPEFYELVFKGLGNQTFDQSLMDKPRLIIEKPFGSNTESALGLQKVLEQYFTEEQIYRIDHYLGKEGLRALDSEREQVIQNVTAISARIYEKIDIEGRGEFYDQTGAIRDIGQNHALEMVAVAGREKFRVDFIKSLQKIEQNMIGSQVVRGQYKGYQAEPEVQPHSQTETYFKISTSVGSGRLQGVHVTLEGGKAMAERLADITYTYRDGSTKVFDIQRAVTKEKPDAYEILIEEAMNGQKNWFVSFAEVVASWQFISPILEHIEEVPLISYKKGTNP